MIDSDCIAGPDWLSEIAACFSDSEVVAIAGNIQGDPPENMIEDFFYTLRPYDVDEKKSANLPMITGNAAYRRTVIEKIGWFDESLPTAGDVDLGWRIKSLGVGKIVYAPEAVVYHKYRSTLKGLYNVFRRYGFSEILLSTIFKNTPLNLPTPSKHILIILMQFKSLVIYLLSFSWRFLSWPLQRRSRKYVLWPLLWFVAESGSIIGKLRGLIATHYFQTNPFPGMRKIAR